MFSITVFRRRAGMRFRSHNILQAQSKRGWQVVALTAPQQEKSSFSKSQERVGGFQYYRAGAVPRGVGLFGTERRLMRVLIGGVGGRRGRKAGSTACPFATVQRYSRASGGA